MYIIHTYSQNKTLAEFVCYNFFFLFQNNPIPWSHLTKVKIVWEGQTTLKNISHFVLTLISNFKKSAKPFEISWSSCNIRTCYRIWPQKGLNVKLWFCPRVLIAFRMILTDWSIWIVALDWSFGNIVHSSSRTVTFPPLYHWSIGSVEPKYLFQVNSCCGIFFLYKIRWVSFGSDQLGCLEFME